MMREGGPDDAPALEAYLAQFPSTTMFLRSNLASHGVGWGASDHSTRFFLWSENERLSAVFGLTRAGFLMAEASQASEDAFAQFAMHLPETVIHGMTGEAASVSGTLDGLGLSNERYKLYRDEPLLHRWLSDLPNAPFKVRRPMADDRGLLSKWFVEYECETGSSQNQAQARLQLPNRLRRALAPETTVRLAVDDYGEVCGMASLNAQVADIVQVGGVFVPRLRRGQGIGRGVTAALLTEARGKGATQAILFPASEAAERAYQGIGFRNVGTYRIALLEASQTVGGKIS